MIENRLYRIKQPEIPGAASLPEIIQKMIGPTALRWYIAQVNSKEVIVEATFYDEAFSDWGDAVTRRRSPGKSAVLHIVPTGVGCRIGGYAGDAAPVTSLLAGAVDYLITNPNAVNASNFMNLDSNVIYTDGYNIDLFCQERVELHVPYANRIGLVIEQSEDWKLDVIFNVVNAVRAVHGVNIVDYVITDGPVGSRCLQNSSGAFVGTVDHPNVILAACDQLIKKGANAIAITTNVQDLPLDNYAQHFAGEYPNPVGGVEAVISYLIANRYRIPVAHAPLLNVKQLDLRHPIVDARGAGEMVSASGLACILMGLRRAPQVRAEMAGPVMEIVNVHNLLAVVAPASCLGGVPVLQAQRRGLPVIAVRGNETILRVSAEKLGLTTVIEVNSYAEAAGVIMAIKKGISLESLTRPLKTMRYDFEDQLFVEAKSGVASTTAK
jgi:hypothetical protein